MHVILTLERAGAQEVVRILCEHLRKASCESVVCTFEDGPVRRDLEELGIPVEVLGARRHGIEALPRFVREIGDIRKKLAGLVERYRIDIVQTHLLQTLDFVALSLLRGTSARAVLWTVHNVDFLPEGRTLWTALKRQLHRLLYQATIHRTSGVIAVSSAVRDALMDQICAAGDRITTIPNGVDVDRFRGPGDHEALCRKLRIDASSRLVLTVGRLTEQKGHRFLIDAAREVVAVHPDAHFLLVGEGELRSDLEERARRLDLAERVHFLGVREDLPFLLASTDLFVMPSLWEGLSIALLEAMAAGRPVVTTAVSGAVEAMVPGETGFVVPPGEAGALAEAIVQLLSDGHRAGEMGKQARQRVAARFGAAGQVERYHALYRSVLRAGGAKG
jgi:starch synthase (maltosyl-transferring)